MTGFEPLCHTYLQCHLTEIRVKKRDTLPQCLMFLRVNVVLYYFTNLLFKLRIKLLNLYV